MAKLTAKRKEELKTAGLLAEFTVHLNALKSEGHKHEEAVTLALDKFRPKLDAFNSADGEYEMRQRTTDMRTNFLWVGRNICNALITMADCPDPIAWEYLRLCRKDDDFRVDFMKSTIPKLLPTRSLLDDDSSNKKIDGADQIETIDRIRAIRRKAEEQGGE